MVSNNRSSVFFVNRAIVRCSFASSSMNPASLNPGSAAAAMMPWSSSASAGVMRRAAKLARSRAVRLRDRPRNAVPAR
jgi:hypothetical protein